MPARISRNGATVSVTEEARTLPVAREADVVILGGGVAGLAAALAAAETGSSVLLIERGNCLGGTATAGMMTLFYTPYRCAHGIPKRIFDRLIAAGGAFPGEIISFDHEIFKTIAFEMVAEKGVALLLHTVCADVIMDGERVCGLILRTGRAQRRAREGPDRRERRRGCRGAVRRADDEGARIRQQDASHVAAVPSRRNRRGAHARLRRGESRGVLQGPEPDDAGYRRPEHPHLRLLRPGRGSPAAGLSLSRLPLFPDRSRDAGSRHGTGQYGAHLRCRRHRSGGCHARRDRGQAAAALLLEFSRKFVPGFANAYILDTASHIGVRDAAHPRRLRADRAGTFSPR